MNRKDYNKGEICFPPYFFIFKNDFGWENEIGMKLFVTERHLILWEESVTWTGKKC